MRPQLLALHTGQCAVYPCHQGHRRGEDWASQGIPGVVGGARRLLGRAAVPCQGAACTECQRAACTRGMPRGNMRTCSQNYLGTLHMLLHSTHIPSYSHALLSRTCAQALVLSCCPVLMPFAFTGRESSSPSRIASSMPPEQPATGAPSPRGLSLSRTCDKCTSQDPSPSPNQP